MLLAIPVVVKFLSCDHRELSNNVSSYLSLAAIDNADMLAKYMDLIVDSILKGERSLMIDFHLGLQKQELVYLYKPGFGSILIYFSWIGMKAYGLFNSVRVESASWDHLSPTLYTTREHQFEQ